MRRPRASLFLPRPDYLRRRLVDAARLLPIFGGFLVLLPILWTQTDVQTGGTARSGIYLFVVWAALVAVAAWLAPRLAVAAERDDALPESESGILGSDKVAQPDRPVDGT